MSTESEPLLSTVSTRQNYIAFPETVDSIYREFADLNTEQQCSSCTSQSIREYPLAKEESISVKRRMSRDSTTETLNDNVEESDRNSKRQPPDSLAYVHRLENFFDMFSSSLYLENNVAVARDHLANERTYLAWVRTSLSTISIGVAITQLFRLDKLNPDMANDVVGYGRPMGMCFIIIGMMYVVFAFIRYFHSQVTMTKGYFPASRGIIIFSTIATLAALITVFVIIVHQH